ncbi:hypothetical protein SGL43_03670 [Streptomyces globisporus]|uniref:Spherulation-specific family 4 protein n=1 Tax=Streptomyces globisporus TaxID=1908 RepID=A0ABM9GZA5_STRGL|nr:hypothetical protein GCM10010264_18890 [Streptomyces globisporus]CAH9416644.1 hypothetical protein SGL43_03670 [Streptomyces globisporus]
MIGCAVPCNDTCNGPGTGDTQYTQAIQRARAAGITVIGYVATGYFGTTGITTRSGSTDPAEWMRQIKSDIDTWYRLYGSAGLGGVFFDEAMSRCGAGNVDVPLHRAALLRRATPRCRVDGRRQPRNRRGGALHRRRRHPRHLRGQ